MCVSVSVLCLCVCLSEWTRVGFDYLTEKDKSKRDRGDDSVGEGEQGMRLEKENDRVR